MSDKIVQFRDRNVACVSWDDFLAGRDYSSLLSCQTSNNNDVDNGFVDMIKNTYRIPYKPLIDVRCHVLPRVSKGCNKGRHDDPYILKWQNVLSLSSLWDVYSIFDDVWVFHISSSNKENRVIIPVQKVPVAAIVCLP